MDISEFYEKLLNTISDKKSSTGLWKMALRYAKWPEPYPFGRKVGRNELCPCGSKKKYKRCCQLKETAKKLF